MMLLIRCKRKESRGNAVLPLRIGATLEVLPEVRVPATGEEQVGHGGGAVWVRSESFRRDWQVVVHDIFTGGTRIVAVPLRPAQFHVHEDGVIVGAEATIGWIDLREARPAWRQIHHKEEMFGSRKAYDLFARAGDWLVAIDDIVWPIYADSFTLVAGGPPIHGAAWSLPAHANGTFLYATLVRAADRDGVLFLVDKFVTHGVLGHRLTAVPIRRNKLSTSDADISTCRETLNAFEGTQRLLAGADFTPWRGLAVHERRVLLAAEGRGLFVLPYAFNRETRPVVVDVGGECRDVMVADGRTWVLVGGTENAVVELRWAGDAAHEVARTRLRWGYDQFMR